MSTLPSTRTNELCMDDQYANEKEQSLLIWLNKMEVGQLNLVMSCVPCKSTIEKAGGQIWNETKNVLLIFRLLDHDQVPTYQHVVGNHHNKTIHFQ